MKLFSVLLVVLGSFVAISRSQCPPNQEYLTCGGCDQICNQGPIACAAVCQNSGCYCLPGYYRQYPFSWSACVPLSYCPGPQYPSSSLTQNTGQSECKTNEEYKECGTCDQYCFEEPFACSAECRKPGCYCKDGYVRSFRGPESICIPKDICPQYPSSSLTQNTGNQCGRNEVYDRCGVGKGCENYCGRGSDACSYCMPGCYCKPGYVRSGPESTALCIPENSCYNCGANEVYDRCGVGKGCENYCGRDDACSYCEPGCYCKPGYVRLGPESTALCIPEDSC